MKNILICIILFSFILSGCGTTLDELTDSSLYNIGKTAALTAGDVILQNNTYPSNDSLSSAAAYAVAPDSLIEIYNASTLRGSELVATGNAAANGTFVIDIGAGSGTTENIYIIVCEYGKEQSAALVLPRN